MFGGTPTPLSYCLSPSCDRQVQSNVRDSDCCAGMRQLVRLNRARITPAVLLWIEERSTRGVAAIKSESRDMEALSWLRREINTRGELTLKSVRKRLHAEALDRDHPAHAFFLGRQSSTLRRYEQVLQETPGLLGSPKLSGTTRYGDAHCWCSSFCGCACDSRSSEVARSALINARTGPGANSHHSTAKPPGSCLTTWASSTAFAFLCPGREVTRI
jgi:hypothetical protein